jgi:uncharacterized protein (TIGR00725 family)
MSRGAQVAVIGPGSADPELDRLAEAVGEGLARAGASVVCGGLGGVMDAAARGAAQADGTVIGIVPGEDRDAANAHCTHVVATGIGQARNLAVVASADAVIAIGGAWGTLAELAFARRLGRPVVALRSWEVSPPSAEDTGIELAIDAAEAVERALAAGGRSQT